MHHLQALKGTLVVSCQPVTGSAMDQLPVIVAMAKAAVDGGAKALRIEGLINVAAVCKAVDVPIIAIVKTDHGAGQAIITATVKEAQALIAAGAKLVAVDAAQRQPYARLASIISCLKEASVTIMADCATYEDGVRAMSLGANIIGTTLSGYTPDTQHLGPEPDYDLLSRYVALCKGTDVLVMAEGRFNSPQQAQKAIQLGADCVTVGSAITRVEHIVGWFNAAISSTKAN